MTPPPELQHRSLADSEWPALAEVLAQSFNVPAEGWALFRDRLGAENIRVCEERGRIVGGYGVYPMAEYWLGRTVGLGGVAGVGVAPDARARGVARAMMEDGLRWMRSRGMPIAGLYPATQTLYRKVGYEQAGERWWFEAPLASLTGFKQEVEVQPVDPMSPEARAEFSRRYRPAHGNLDRSPAIWGRITQPYVGRRYAWLIGADGYLVAHHAPPSDPHFDLEVVDLQVPSGPTARTALALLAGHRSLAKNVRWFGASADALLAQFPETTWSVKQYQRWMLRVLDVPAALSGRGWPAGASGELHFDLDDPIFPENHGRWVLRVSGGHARVDRGGRATLRMPIRALGPLYSGMFSASAIAGIGWLSGSAQEIATADLLFAAPIPWMREMY